MDKRVVKLAALLMCGLFALGLVLSLALAIEHGGHCNHAATCSACYQIRAMRELLKQLVLALAVVMAMALLRARAARAMGFIGIPELRSPVALKVRMNN